MQTISANALSFLEDQKGLPAVTFQPRGRRVVVSGRPADVARVVAAGKAVDLWIAADDAMRRRYFRQLAGEEATPSATLWQELARVCVCA